MTIASDSRQLWSAFLRCMSAIVLRMRWLFLFVYLVLVVGFVIVGLNPQYEGFLVAIVFAFILQILFLALRGNSYSLLPVRPRELAFPVIIGALMGAVLLASMVLAFAYQFKIKGMDTAIFHYVLIFAWVFCALCSLLSARS